LSRTETFSSIQMNSASGPNFHLVEACKKHAIGVSIHLQPIYPNTRAVQLADQPPY
jgi:hypothetical protein